MNVEYNDWSVTIYADGDDEKLVLIQIVEIAKKKKLSFGSAGFLPLPLNSPPRQKDDLAFVSLLHCDEEEAKRLLAPHLDFALFCKVGEEE